MERYHIYKLGLAIVFYAIYCRRPMLANALQGGNDKNATVESTTPVVDDYYYVYYQGVEGLPGVDFPILSHIPRTTFTCKDEESGYYADLETDCQVFHICNEGKKVSFLCPNGTIFQQGDLICDWWFKVNCTNSPNLYEESAEQLRADNLRRKESRKVAGDENHQTNNNRDNNLRRGKETNTVARKSYHADSQKAATAVTEARNRAVTTRKDRHESSSSEETQIPQETASFVKSKYNSVHQMSSFSSSSAKSTVSHANHRQTYSELKDPKNYYHHTTTQSYSRSFDAFKTTLNNRQPFVSTTTVSPSTASPRSQSTNVPPHQRDVEKKQRIEVHVVQERPTVKFVDSKTSIGEILSSSSTTVPSNHQPYYESTPLAESNKRAYKNELQATKSTIKSLSSNKFHDGIEEATSYDNKQRASATATATSGSFSSPSNTVHNVEFVTASGSSSSAFDADRKPSVSTRESRVFHVQSTTPSPADHRSKSIDHTAKYSGGFVSNSLSPFAEKDGRTATESNVIRVSIGNNQGERGTSTPTATANEDFTEHVPTTAGAIVEAASTARTRDYAVVTGRFDGDDAPTTPNPSDRSTTLGRNTYLPTGKNLAGTSAATEQIFGLFTPAPKGAVDRENTGAPRLSSTPRIARIETEDVYVPSRSPRIHQPKPFEASDAQEVAAATDNRVPSSNALSTTQRYDISSASPFNRPDVTAAPTEPTPIDYYDDNVSNMINTLTAILGRDKMMSLVDLTTEDAPRPGLTPPPSAGPQTLLTLANYFASALDDIMSDKEEEEMNKETIINELLSMNTVNKYKELFEEKTAAPSTTTTTTITSSQTDLQADDTRGLAESPRVRQLAQTFTKALSSYLDDPENFRNALKEIRPTEPPPAAATSTTRDDDEVLKFSDGDGANNKFNLANHFNDVKPTWGFILGLPQGNNVSDGEHLQNADTQSFVAQLNSLNKAVRSTTTPTYLSTAAPTTATSIGEETISTVANRVDDDRNLPTNHWTSSPDATRLWRTTLQVNPHAINRKLDVHHVPTTTTTTPDSSSGTTESNAIEYTIGSLPTLDLNETQVHGLLIDFVNASRTDDENNRLTRILHKLNTTEDEFLVKMQEIEKNPLTRRLILLLISECEPGTKRDAIRDIVRLTRPDGEVDEPEEAGTAKDKSAENQDARALELLNSLYTIAARYGK